MITLSMICKEGVRILASLDWDKKYIRMADGISVEREPGPKQWKVDFMFLPEQLEQSLDSFSAKFIRPAMLALWSRIGGLENLVGNRLAEVTEYDSVQEIFMGIALRATMTEDYRNWDDVDPELENKRRFIIRFDILES